MNVKGGERTGYTAQDKSCHASPWHRVRMSVPVLPWIHFAVSNREDVCIHVIVQRLGINILGVGAAVPTCEHDRSARVNVDDFGMGVC